jgi:hypothetical protein
VRAKGTIAILGIFLAIICGFVVWLRGVPYDKHWRKPSHLIRSFLGAAQNQDYVQARTFFSDHQITNITAWEGSFDTWCSQFTGYADFELGRTGRGKADHYWTDIFGVAPDGNRKLIERLYSKKSDGVWSLEYGLSYEQWLILHESEMNAQP